MTVTVDGVIIFKKENKKNLDFTIYLYTKLF